MVNDIDETNPDILEWLPNGEGFRINDEVSNVPILAQSFLYALSDLHFFFSGCND
jgi:hypothetical protein